MEELDKPVISTLEEYVNTGSKESWDKLYLLIYKCIENLAKKEYKGVYNPNFEDRVGDAVYLMMIKIKEYPNFKENMLRDLKQNPKRHVVSYCYWPMLSQLRGRKQIKEDMEYSYDYIMEFNRRVEIDREENFERRFDEFGDYL